MHITQQQWVTLGSARFAIQMWGTIRRTLNYDEPPPEDFAGFCRRSSAGALRYGLRDELSQARFVFAAWVLGEEFHVRIPALRLVLQDPELSNLERSAALISFMQVFFGELLAQGE